MTDDTISRQAAIGALGEEPLVWHEDDAGEVAERNQWRRDVAAIKALPSAQPTEASCWGCNCLKMERLKEQKTFSEMIHLHDADKLKADCHNCGARMDEKDGGGNEDD